MKGSDGVPISRDVRGEVVYSLIDVAESVGVSPNHFFREFEHILHERPIWIDWESACTIFDRISELGDKMTPEKAGKAAFVGPSTMVLKQILGLVATPKTLFSMIWKWGGPRTFPMLRHSFEVLPDGRFRGTIWIPETLRDCPNLLRFNTGGCEAATRVIGLPDSHVEATTRPREHVMIITPPPSLSLWGRIRQMLGARVSVSVALKELAAQREQLALQHAELRAAYESVSAHRHAAELAQRQAERALIVKTEFLSAIGHELRTPLNGIIGGLDVMRDEISESNAELFAIVDQSANTLNRLVDHLLDSSRFEAGQVVLRKHRFDPRLVISRVIEAYRGSAREKKVEIVTEMSDSIPAFAIGDAARVGQALRCLVDNAIKYTNDGEIRVRVRAKESSIHADDWRLEIEVQDTGIGIAPERRGQIFEIFSQAEGGLTRSHGGAGLGLAISSRVLGILGGGIRVESELGKGSTFTMEVPLGAVRQVFDAPKEETVEYNERGEPKIVASTVAQKPCVLIIDDDASLRHTLTAMLKRIGCDSQAAASGEEALALAERGRFDAYLLDLELPGLNGFDIAARIRSGEGPLERTPIIAVTHHDDTHHRIRCKDAGMDDFLSKPVRLPEMQKCLDYWVFARPSASHDASLEFTLAEPPPLSDETLELLHNERAA
jgi:signal transduction histidine kinase/CheY-like chemotaxis protein